MSIVCHTCNKPHGNMLRCGKCKFVYYCSRECQKVDWKDHKHMCQEKEESLISEIRETIIAIENNPKFTGLLLALLHYWSLKIYKNGYISCYIKSTKKNIEGMESFYECALMYVNPETHPEQSLNFDRRNVSITYEDTRLGDNFMKMIISFDHENCKSSYTSMKNTINFTKIKQPLVINVSDIDFCAFVCGDELISL